MKYHHGVSQHSRKRYLKRIYVFMMIIVALTVLIFIAIRLDSFLQEKANTPDATTSQQTSAYFASSDKIFTTDYFQFQAPKNWVEIPSESTKTQYIYRGVNKPIIEDELVVYVNEIPDDISGTRLLPADITDGGNSLSPDSLSGHCKEASANDNIDTKVLTYKKVRMNCDVDNTQFNVLVGLKGGTTRMSLKRPDGSSAEYTILYRNVKAIPDAAQLIDIIKSFQTR